MPARNLPSQCDGGLWTAELHNARVIANARLIALDDGRVIAGLQSLHGTPRGLTTRTFRRIRLLNRRVLSGVSLMLGAPCGDNYFHWLFDCLPRLKICFECGVDLKNVQHILLDGHVNRNLVRDTFEILELPFEKVVYLNNREIVQCEELTLPSMTVPSPGEVANWIVEWLRETFAGQHSTPPIPPTRKLFIAREPSTSRRLINRDLVQNQLESLGFETHYLRGKKITEQVSLFRSAKIVVAQHGAALTNLSFCEPGTKLVEIISPGHSNRCYADLAAVHGIERKELFGQPCDDKSGLDITVNIPELTRMVQ